MGTDDIIFSANVPADLASSVDDVAKKQMRTRANLICVALKEYVEKYKDG
jgi:metal-responsive CopG/Arc/MetJ family transcriptional regulator